MSVEGSTSLKKLRMLRRGKENTHFHDGRTCLPKQLTRVSQLFSEYRTG